MSQTAIATKTSLSATTGSASYTFDVAGRDTNGNVRYRAVVDSAVPASDTILSISSGSKVDRWISTIKNVTPLMETISSGDSSGYVAMPKVADNFIMTIKISRPDRMTTANAIVAMDRALYALMIDAKLRVAALGYAPADA